VAANLSVVAFDAVRRLQLFREQHPGVLVELHSAPVWHWSAWPVKGQEIVSYDLGELLDTLAAALTAHPAPPHDPAETPGLTARPADIPVGD
jgi:hypothetical protein